MITRYFKSDRTEAAIKREYRELCKIHHPDIGGDESTMKEINAEYLTLLESINGQESKDSAGKTHYYRFDKETERNIMEMLRKLQNLRLPNTVEIALIGTWIWVTGDTKPYSMRLNKKTGIGLDFHATKACWYWRPSTYRSYSRGKGNFFGMACQYGYQKMANSMKDSGKAISQ